MPYRRMRQFRKQRDLSIEEVSISIGVHQNTIANWEKLRSTPGAEKLICLSAMYGRSPSELMEIVEDEGD
nr:MAG TPA: helix-turn-helix domain protein [Caudoviricetes sp.]